MSTTSLPSYTAPLLGRTPTYTAEPQASEQRLALSVLQPRPSGEFTKQSKGGGVSLRLFAQENGTALPTYGHSASIDGAIDIAKPEGVNAVEVKIKGTLRLKEIAEGGTATHELALTKLSLWNKDRDGGQCPTSLPFSLGLPPTFNDGKDDYPLPPTFEAHLTGMPGFRAIVGYSVSAMVDRGLVKKAASTFFPKPQIDSSVSTDFIYFPRSRPAVPLPPPMMLVHSNPGVLESSEWRCFESRIPARTVGVTDIITKLYIPASRVYCMSEPIPFHLSLVSSAYSLAAFMPYGPTASLLAPHKQHTQIRLLRQSIVDVRNTVVFGTKTDIWRVTCIGTGTFARGSDGPDFISFAGEIRIAEDLKIPGFKAGGLLVKDCIVLTMVPPDVTKSPFDELRCVVPMRLVTDPWTNDGSGTFEPSEYSSPSSEEDATSQRFVDFHGQ
ncbi:uncharacterized protein PHACADRAFT_261993 [Phanerochaete carnosa HHB-10118-sp]|uniref:Arrestin-like N-terminal domain-containing protein n=1 Tax=Phanerochaete carnosa (strain HHB-10118-sp) TaxID=650164 RepID=K5VK02_PHACS|nr:uncharacterized protein PHACADRAFT_261993 [Phanerochaete carnosa HHB-10118-sp]EKM51698.1 hypothetical protein PHACADRAFT_261993 [Phanerochaete carnosa HHB-10118-sp]